jgi:hypothetical protein
VQSETSIIFLDVVAWAGDLSARVKGIVNCIKVQVPAQLPGTFSSKISLQFQQTHQECGLVCEAVEGPAFTASR